MHVSDSAHPRLDTRTGQLLRRCLSVCRYREDLIASDFALDSNRTIPVVTFAHYPRDARSSCLAFLPQSETLAEDLAPLRELGVPLVFFVGSQRWEMWSLRVDGPRLEKRLDAEKVVRFFETHREEFAPGSVFRAKTWARAEGARQLDFVDTGLLPLVEKEAGARLRQLFEQMLGHTLDALDVKPTSLSNAESHALVRANFWLLAGKLMRDKSVPNFTRLDLHDVQGVFDRVADHYDAPRINANGRLKALRGAADLAVRFASFRCISTETLGALYEEALLSPRTRTLLSVHRTPTYLVDYMLARMSGWMENEIGIENCRVWEPSCGHAPFLVGAVRLLSELLPERIASDRDARRKFLRTHIGGCDRDAFALEIARLSLTLADIPHHNGWKKLDPVKDMFDGDYLAEKIAANSVIIANPPFENVEISAQERASGDLRYARSGQAGELLRRVVHHAAPGSLFGIVIPQGILDGASFRSLRSSLLEKVEIREIVTFPDNVFKFAKPETAVIFGKKLPDGNQGASAFRFRRVTKPDMEAFRNECRVPTGFLLSGAAVMKEKRRRLAFPHLSAVWAAANNLPRMASTAFVSIGFYFYPENDPKFPKGEIQVSGKEQLGFRLGFLTAENSPDYHLHPKLKWLNQKSEIIEWECGGTALNQPQVLLNKARASRSKWRHKAFVDSVGRPFTDRFICFRPLGPTSLEVLWALVNSPFANACTFTDSPRADFSPKKLSEMPVPKLEGADLKPLEVAVRAYHAAARAFSESQHGEPPQSKRRTKQPSAKAAAGDAQLALDGIAEAQTADAAREHLRALHWRVDAEVLKLYALPAELERELLDFFDGVPRVGVPFEQRGYIPLGFRETLRLDEFLRITDEWDATDERRCQLIEKRLHGGKRTPAEEEEFAQLQELFRLRRDFTRWQRTGNAHSPLIDEAKLRQLALKHGLEIPDE